MCFRGVGDDLTGSSVRFLAAALVFLTPEAAVFLGSKMSFRLVSKITEADWGSLSDLHPCRKWT